MIGDLSAMEEARPLETMVEIVLVHLSALVKLLKRDRGNAIVVLVYQDRLVRFLGKLELQGCAG